MKQTESIKISRRRLFELAGLSSYAKNFSGKYSHRIIKGVIGHNLPQEAPQAFAEAVIEVDGY